MLVFLWKVGRDRWARRERDTARQARHLHKTPKAWPCMKIVLVLILLIVLSWILAGFAGVVERENENDYEYENDWQPHACRKSSVNAEPGFAAGGRFTGTPAGVWPKGINRASRRLSAS